MYLMIIKNDIKKSKLITVTITVFIMVAALLTALGTSMVINLFGAIDNLMLDAKGAHYILMHSGDIDRERLSRFAADYEGVEELQIAEFLNIEGGDIIIGDQSLAASIQDNGVSVQNKNFDFLLDLNNQPIIPLDGEIYVPVYYMTEGAAKLGDRITIQGVSFTVAGFLRDSIMNPVMTSSKRFLISEHDYELLRNGGILEYLIEFRFSEGMDVAGFESAYIGAGLEDNGPPGTYCDLVRMMHGITDGIVIAMLLLVSSLILVVTFLCVRFTLVSKVEEEYRQIGVLKAIGLRVSEIKKIYLAKYSAIAAIGCSLGFLLSLTLQKMMLANIHLYMGRSGREGQGLLFGGCGAVFIFAVVIMYVVRVLRRFGKISPSQAIRYGAPTDKRKISKGFSLAGRRILPTTLFLGIKEVISRTGLYLVMLSVLVISCFILIVPKNIQNTIADRSFMTYMGIGECDISMGIQLADRIPERTAAMEEMLQEDPDIEAYSIFISRLFDLPMTDGSVGKLRVEIGDHTTFPLTYTRGREPRQEDEISLSTFNGTELKKDIGDTIVLTVNGLEKELTICGIYSDVTNGGMSAKACFEPGNERVLWSKIPVKLRDISRLDNRIASYRTAFPYAKIAKVDDYRDQSLGTTLRAVQAVFTASVAVAVLLTVLITLLFMKMLVIKDRYQISVLKSLGFTDRSIRQQYLVRAGLMLVLGLLIGTMAANTLGEWIGVAMMSSFGVSSFHFKINAAFAYVITPLLITGCVYTAALIGISDIKSITISQYMKE